MNDLINDSNCIVTNCGHIYSENGILYIFKWSIDKRCLICKEKLIIL